MDSVANPAIYAVDIELEDARPVRRDEIHRHDEEEAVNSGLDVMPAYQDGSDKEHSTTRNVEVAVLDSDLDVFPEGGLQAWLVVVGAWFILFPSFGFPVAIGTVQEYIHAHQLSAYTTRDVGWIPSVFCYLVLSIGILVGPIFDRYGPRYLALIGSTLFVVMMFLLAECQTYWQFMLCLGVFGGIVGATLPTTALAAVSHWFKVRRGLTAGIAMIGSSFGGLAIPLILRSSLPIYGYKWSIRILAFTFLGCLTVGNILLKARLPPLSKSHGTKPRSLVSLRTFGDARFTLFTCSVFGFEAALFGVLGVLPTYATLNPNYPPNTSFYLISVLNGVSCLGRIIPGVLADRYGRFNMLSIMAALTLFVMLVLWLPPTPSPSLPTLYAIAALFGFGSGSWMALVPACLGQLCRAEEFGRYYGTMYFVASLATLVCIPIGGQLLDTIGPRALVGFFCAVTAAALAALLGSRYACLGWRWKWRVKV